MNILKKYAFYGSAVVASLALALVMLVSSTPRVAHAATTVTTLGDTSVKVLRAGTDGNGVWTNLSANIVLTGSAVADFPIGTIVIDAPSGWQFNNAIAADVVVTGAGLAANAAVTYNTVSSVTGAQMVVTVTAANTAAPATITIGGVTKPQMRPTALASATGTMKYNATTSTGDPVGLVDQTSVGTITAVQPSTPYTITITSSTGSTTVNADGSNSLNLTATLLDATGEPVAFRIINWSSSVGIIGTGTSKTATGATTTAGTQNQSTYRCVSGSAATDTVIASNTQLSVVGTLSITCVTSSGTTAAKIAFNAPTQTAVAATVTNKSPGYISPTMGTNISVKVTDAAGLGVNTQTVLITASKGFLIAGFGGACPGTAKAVTGTTATLAPSVGATAEAGIVQLTFCASQDDAAGAATLTAQNVSTTMANGTATISMAGRPNKVAATVTGNAIAAKVTDVDGNAVADGTPVRFTISANAGAVSTTCTTSSNGAATSVVALIGASGTVIVSTDWNETGVASTCAAAGAQQAATSVVVGTGGTVTPPAGSTGTFAAAPVFSSSKLANVVFLGGTVAQLDTALVAAGGTGAWAQGANGVFVLYVVNGGFVNDIFKAAFPTGLPNPIALTIVGK